MDVIQTWAQKSTSSKVEEENNKKNGRVKPSTKHIVIACLTFIPTDEKQNQLFSHKVT